MVSVKTHGAKGDGRTDDTKAIQSAIDEVAGTGGTVLVPKGTYRVRANGKSRLRLKSKMTFQMASGAVLAVIPTGSAYYSVLRISGVSDVNVVGGTLQGDRREHKARGGEWGQGIIVGPESVRINISNVTSQNMWGDGFYVAGGQDIAFCSVQAKRNRRQGLSIVDGSRILVTRSVFSDTSGTRPSAGIDLEPNHSKHHVTGVRIERSKFVNNDGGGIMITAKKGRVSKVQILNNYFEGLRPILVEDAPKVASSQICDNRYVPFRGADKGGFEKFTDPVKMVAMQTDCRNGRDIRFQTTRNSKKKKRR